MVRSCSKNLFSDMLDPQGYFLYSESNRIFSGILSFDEQNPKTPPNSVA